MPIKRALLSVSDKTGIVEFARKLHEAGVEIISTGGTMKAIDDAGIPVTYVSDVTKPPSNYRSPPKHYKSIYSWWYFSCS